MWHLGKLLVLPLIAMIAGLTSLYIDPKQNPWGKKILLAVLLIGAAGSVAIVVSDDHDKQQEDQKASDNARDMRNIALNQSQALSTIRGTTEDILAKLSSFGWTGATLAEVTKSVSADNARKSLLPQLQSDKTHGQVTITYFPKQVDGPVVFNALREGGFNVTKGAGNDVNKDLPTNAIWVGWLYEPRAGFSRRHHCVGVVTSGAHRPLPSCPQKQRTRIGHPATVFRCT